MRQQLQGHGLRGHACPVAGLDPAVDGADVSDGDGEGVHGG